jgi:hypothetical protein
VHRAPVYPSLPSPPLADDSLADASVLIERAARQQALRTEEDIARDAITAALDAATSDDDDDESELASDVEEVPVRVGSTEAETIWPKAMPTNHATKVMQPLPSGDRDPVRRMKHTFDPAAQEALFGSDSESEEEAPALDEDQEDDQEQWQRIPAHLKGKGRAKDESDDEQWINSSEPEDEEQSVEPDLPDLAPRSGSEASVDEEEVATLSRSRTPEPQVIEISDSDDDGSPQEGTPVDEEDQLVSSDEVFRQRNGVNSPDAPTLYSSSPELEGTEATMARNKSDQREGGAKPL